ncbi:MAG: tetratricopeptide repeat protein [Treponema sp.]|nr:tetratricopeptide repeat protein [Treponema sp.]
MNDYNFDYDDSCDEDEHNGYDDEASQVYIKFLEEKEKRDKPLKEAPLTEKIIAAYNFYHFELEHLEGNYIEEYGKTGDNIDLESSEWALNDLYNTGKPLPGIDPRTGAYGPVIASIAFTHAGNEYSKLGEYEKAIDNFSKAIEINPRNIQAYLDRGVTRCLLGDYEHAALEDLWDSIDLNPLRLAKKNEQSRAFLKNLEYSGIHDLTLILAESLNARGAAYFKAKYYDEAFNDFDEAIKYTPNKYQLYIHRGAVNSEFWHYEEAVADYTEALRLQPDFALAYSYRANAYIDMDKYEEAIADYDKKFSMVPGSACEYINRALCYARLHDKPRAIRDAETALSLEPSNQEVIDCRDGIFREMEEYESTLVEAI